ncbi:hypothetical protein F2Q65_03600 [Thiohalocapsa marina]|uniref:L-dopachrome isomerase n=1 Tax=Thiohalocapsa marina TaxID=424902 RepID=A0A5M8FT58_9GAMM|nr:phenylpyruvate tautomerase MIF-related protein [Thiohalocapsa marina]KAA6186984.1 hypothetical protein F2Q65_03600 [Thiohalocapsa marina]
MPTLIIKTNADLTAVNRPELLRSASGLVAEMLGKPERYVMVMVEAVADMCMAGDTAPLAYLELKSLGLPEAQTAAFSARLCDFIEQYLGIPAQRIYIEFASPPRHLFGHNRATF